MRHLRAEEFKEIRKIPNLLSKDEAVYILPTLVPVFLGVFEDFESFINFANQYYGGIDNMAVGSMAFIRFNRAGLIGEKGLSLITIEKGNS